MRSAAVLCVSFLTLTAAACREQPVTRRASTAPDRIVSTGAELPLPRTEVAGAALGGKIVVVGGLLPDGSATARVDVYDPDADAWSEGPPLPAAAHHVGMTAAGSRVWVAGGFGNGPDDRWRELREVWSLGAGESSWRAEPPLREPRAALALAVAADTIVAVGGVTYGAAVVSTEVLRGGGPREWVTGPRLNERREHLAATTIGSRVYAIGGRMGSLESTSRTVESWDTDAGSWELGPALAERRGGMAAAGACVTGGEVPGETVGSVECLRDGEWVTVAHLARPRHGLAVVALGSDLHVIGGGERPGLHVSGAHEVVHVPPRQRR